MHIKVNIHDVSWKVNPPEPGHKGSHNHYPPEEVDFHRVGEPRSLWTIGEPGSRATHNHDLMQPPGGLVRGDRVGSGGTV